MATKPKGLAPYGLDPLSDELLGLIDDMGVDRLPVVAHDWGGAVAWWGALRFPERIARLALLNVPHPAVLRRALRGSAAQRRRSRYMAYFQLPWLPERKLRVADFRALRAIFRRTSRPGTFSEEELARYAAAAARPGALTATLNWYRAALWCPPRKPPHRLVAPLVRILWGAEDRALGRELVEPSAARCRAAEIHWIEQAGHWVQHEAAAEVTRSLLDFLA
jgi:pimeloyl-ACP methyl ester carboxylesterase